MIRKSLLLFILVTSAILQLSAVEPAVDQFKISAYKLDTIEAEDVEFEVSIEEYQGDDDIPDDGAEILLDYEDLDRKGFSKLKLFTVEIEGNLATPVDVDVVFKRFNDTADSSKFITSEIVYERKKPGTKVRYSKPVLYEPAEDGSGYYCYYYLYNYESDTSRNGWLNRGEDHHIPLHWIIKRQYCRTKNPVAKRSQFRPDEKNDTKLTSLAPIVARGTRPIVALPEDYKGDEIEFFLEVDYYLKINKSDWDAAKEQGHSYRMEVIITIEPLT